MPEKISRYQALLNGLILNHKNIETGTDGKPRVVLRNSTNWSPHAYRALIFTGRRIFAIPYAPFIKGLNISLDNTFIGKSDTGTSTKADKRDDLFSVLYKTPGSIQAKVRNVRDIIIFYGEGQDAIRTASGRSDPVSICQEFGFDALSTEMCKGDESTGVIRCGDMAVTFLDSTIWRYDPSEGIVCAKGEQLGEKVVRAQLVQEKLAFVEEYTGGSSVVMQTKAAPDLAHPEKYSLNEYVWDCLSLSSSHRQEKKAEGDTFRDVCTLTTDNIKGVKFGNLITYADVFDSLLKKYGKGTGIQIQYISRNTDYSQIFYASPSNYPCDRKLMEYISENYFKPLALMQEIEKYQAKQEARAKTGTADANSLLCSAENFPVELKKLGGCCLNTLLTITRSVHMTSCSAYMVKTSVGGYSEELLAKKMVRVLPVSFAQSIPNSTALNWDAVLDAVAILVYVFMKLKRTKPDASGNQVEVAYDAEMTEAREIVARASSTNRCLTMLEYLYLRSKNVLAEYKAGIKRGDTIFDVTKIDTNNPMTFPVGLLGGLSVQSAMYSFAQMTLIYSLLYEAHAFYPYGLDSDYYVAPSYQACVHESWTNQGISAYSIPVASPFVLVTKTLYGNLRYGTNGVTPQEYKDATCWELMFSGGVYSITNNSDILGCLTPDTLRLHRSLINKIKDKF